MSLQIQPCIFFSKLYNSICNDKRRLKNSLNFFCPIYKNKVDGFFKEETSDQNYANVTREGSKSGHEKVVFF